MVEPPANSDRSEFGGLGHRPQLLVVDGPKLPLSLVVPIQFYQFPNDDRTAVFLTQGLIGAILANDRYWPDVCKDGRDI